MKWLVVNCLFCFFFFPSTKTARGAPQYNEKHHQQQQQIFFFFPFFCYMCVVVCVTLFFVCVIVYRRSQRAKLRSVLHYFQRLNERPPEGHVTFARQVRETIPKQFFFFLLYQMYHIYCLFMMIWQIWYRSLFTL